jgi:DNA (cytosine-5)-methyltransferase 1
MAIAEAENTLASGVRMNYIPVIDLFAGPGGLGEGFSALKYGSRHPFRIRLSVEKDAIAHQTLSLRCFFRQFREDKVPDDYYQHLRGEITLNELFQRFPSEARTVTTEVLRRELGKPKDDVVVDEHLSHILLDNPGTPWVLIGGPPCQAYSTAGRVKIKALDPDGFESDERHFLYQEYLRIIRKFKPSIFVVENVTGILSSRIKGKRIFRQILRDLRNPSAAVDDHLLEANPAEYNIYSLAVSKEEPMDLEPADFIIECERYGIPQARHRVIILGIRSDFCSHPSTLTENKKKITMHDVISDLPKIRSALSRELDSGEAWRSTIMTVLQQTWIDKLESCELKQSLRAALEDINACLSRGGEFLRCSPKPNAHARWYVDGRLGGVCNHSARGHLASDLHRYLFAACFGQVNGFSPRMRHFPEALYPEHKNVAKAVAGKMFPDRFRVQLRNAPATTVTSHMSKDGHYFIHYDPCQCRSLTVREAARLQTFPDNYFFEGGRTAQYKQVGNAVPPLLARQIAVIVYDVICKEKLTVEDDGHYKPRKEKLEYVANPVQKHSSRNNRKVTLAQDGLPVSSALGEAAGKT